MSAEYIRSILAPYSFKMPPPAEMKVIVEVLELYKRLPCLWDPAHHLYHTKEERNRAYHILLEKYKTINPDATRDIMKKKIDNMRNAYRREYKKVCTITILNTRGILLTEIYLFFFIQGYSSQSNGTTSAYTCIMVLPSLYLSR